MASVRKSFISNLLLTALNIILPLVTYPFATRVLGPREFGLASYYGSVSEWLIFAMSLGIPAYGVREIAKCRNHAFECSKVITELIAIQSIAAVMAALGYCSLYFLSPLASKNPGAYFCYLLPVLFAGISVDWIYGGLEKYPILATRTFVIKLLYAASVFFFVKRENGLITYAALSVASLLLNNVTAWWYGRGFLKLYKGKLNFVRHWKPMFYFWMCFLVGSVYAKGDLVLLGAICGEESVGFLAIEKRIVLTVISVTGALSTVLIPRMSNLLAEKKTEEYQELLQRSIVIVVYAASFLMAALIAFRMPIVSILFNRDFSGVSDGLLIIAPLVVLSSVSGIIGLQVIVPLGLERKMIIMSTVSAVSNVAINLLLMKKFAHLAGATAIVISEGVGVLAGWLIIRKNVKLRFDVNVLINISLSIAISTSIVGSLGSSSTLNLNIYVAMAVNAFLFTCVWAMLLYAFRSSDLKYVIKLLPNFSLIKRKVHD